MNNVRYLYLSFHFIFLGAMTFIIIQNLGPGEVIF